MKPPRSRIRSSRAAAGFTLVELMVSMVIGLFIVLSLLTLLINVNRNNSEMARSNLVIENGRFALQLMEADLSHAGFWGGYLPQFDDLTVQGAPSDVPAAVPDPCRAYGAWDAAYATELRGIAVQAYEIPAIVPSPTLPVCATKVVSPKPATDVLVVRHLDTCAAGADPGCPGVTASDVYFQPQRCTASDNANFSTAAFALGTTKSTANGLGTATTTFDLGAATSSTLMPMYDRDCATPTPAYKYVENLYYVRNYAVTPGDGVPTLMRSQFTAGAHQAADAMIEGIEGFRIEVGIDNVSDAGMPVNFAAGPGWADLTNLKSPANRGDGIPDAYVRCTTAAPCTAAQLMNAVAIKLYVLVRSETRTAGYSDTKTYCLASSCPTAADRVGPFNDGYKRHLFAQTVRLVNLSARRETPP